MILTKADILNRNQESFNLRGVTQIEEGTFEDCPNLTSLTNTEDLEIIGDFAFRGTPLAIADFPNVSKVGNYAFFECENLTEALFPKLLDLGAGAFKSCISLEYVNMPLVERLQIHTFQNSGLLSIQLPKCSFISTLVFENSESLETAIFPNLKTIGRFAFKGCSNLKRFTSLTLESFGDAPFKECDAMERLDIGGECQPLLPLNLFGTRNYPNVKLYINKERLPELSAYWSSIDTLPERIEGFIFSASSLENYSFFDENLNPLDSYEDAVFYKNNSETKTIQLAKSLTPEFKARWGEVSITLEKISDTFERTRGHSPSYSELKDYILSKPELYCKHDNIWTILSDDWAIGFKEDLEELRNANNTPFLSYKIWSASERTSSEAYAWYPKDSEDRDEYGFFKSLFCLYLRNLYLTSEDASQWGLHPALYRVNPIDTDFEEKNSKGAYEAWFETIKVTPEEFETGLTPLACFRQAFNDCISGFQTYTELPYFAIKPRDSKGDVEEESPIKLYTVYNTKNLSGERWITGVTAYPPNNKLNGFSTILPIKVDTVEGEISSGESKPLFKKYLITYESADDFLREIYGLSGELTGEELVAPDVTLNEDLINFVPERSLIEIPAPTEEDPEFKWTSATTSSSKGILAEKLKPLEKYSCFDGSWHTTSKRAVGSVLFVKYI